MVVHTSLSVCPIVLCISMSIQFDMYHNTDSRSVHCMDR